MHCFPRTILFGVFRHTNISKKTILHTVIRSLLLLSAFSMNIGADEKRHQEHKESHLHQLSFSLNKLRTSYINCSLQHKSESIRITTLLHAGISYPAPPFPFFLRLAICKYVFLMCCELWYPMTSCESAMRARV